MFMKKKKMPNNYKYYELYSLGCFTARTEPLAVSFGLGALLFNAFLFLFSFSSDWSYWSIGPPALFHMFAALALFYAAWADRSTFCWFYLVINGFTIAGALLAFSAAFLLDANPQFLEQFRDEFASVRTARNELRLLELGFLLLLVCQWIAQGLVWHYYHYLKYRKAEQFFLDAAATTRGTRVGSFHVSNMRRMQFGNNAKLPQTGSR